MDEKVSRSLFSLLNLVLACAITCTLLVHLDVWLTLLILAAVELHVFMVVTLRRAALRDAARSLRVKEEERGRVFTRRLANNCHAVRWK